jgi:hypothetical protein
MSVSVSLAPRSVDDEAKPVLRAGAPGYRHARAPSSIRRGSHRLIRGRKAQPIPAGREPAG